MKIGRALPAILLGIFLFVGALVGPMFVGSATAQQVAELPHLIRLDAGTSRSASYTTSAFQWGGDAAGNPTNADVFLHVTMPTVNTTTFVLQASADGSQWANHTTIASGVVTTTNLISSVTIKGRYVRMVGTALTTTTFTSLVNLSLR